MRKMSDMYVLPDVGVEDVRGVYITRCWCERCQRCMCYPVLVWKMSEVYVLRAVGVEDVRGDVLPDVGVDNSLPDVGVEDVRGACVT